MDMNFAVFQEPRGVMRILHFVFSICAFATISGYGGHYKCNCKGLTDSGEFGYPFMFDKHCRSWISQNTTKCVIDIVGDFSSDAKFFVATGVLAMLYSIAIMYVYAKFDDMYKTNMKIPLYDFLVTVIFGVLWLSSSAAWANGLTGLKSATNPELTPECKECSVSTGSFSTLDISVIFGFLNFFLWAADLWFLYKETAWFPGNQQRTTEGV